MSRSVALLYDGACRFCIRSLRALKRFDLHDRLELIDATDRDAIARRFPQTAGADFDAAMYAVDQHGVYRGFDAFRRALRETPVLAWLVPLLYVPGMAQIGRLAYDAIARHRHSLGCTSEVCKP
ncbi:MAG: thiol-disulfide oxidoreductase DCC family protein [Vulcanimicrobiaceae bacterium]